MISTSGDFQRMAMPQLQAAYRLAHALLRSAAEAEDAVQDSYLRAFRARAQFRGGDFKPWFLTIVRNVCYRQLQSRKRSFNVISLDEVLSAPGDEEQHGFDVASEAPTPEESLAQAQQALQLNKLMGELPPALREALHLREVEELSYQQIAAATGVPVGTVMSRLARAREKLTVLFHGAQVRDGKNVL